MARRMLPVLLALCLAGAARAEPPLSRPGVDAPELARLGEHRVGVRTLVLTQAAQPDVLAYDAKSTVAPLRDRALTVDIWYPASTSAGDKLARYRDALPAEPPRPPAAFEIQGLAVRDAPALKGGFPLVVVSHGYSGTPAAMTWLTENLASKGYVVAAIHHCDPDISDRAKAVAPMLRRPLDIAFVARALREGQGGPAMAGADPGRLALIGYSMGGYGALTVAGAALDPAGGPVMAVPGGLLKPYARGGIRAAELTPAGLKAVVAIAPAGAGFAAWGPAGLAQLTTPLLVIGGDRDRTVGFAEGIRPVFDQAIHAERRLLVFQNGGHAIGMGGAPATMRDQLWNLDWFEDPVWRAERIAAVQQHMITAFLDRHVKGDATRAAYLTTDTAMSNDTRWPASGPSGYAAISPGGPGATWKGFPRNHAVGLELHQASAAP